MTHYFTVIFLQLGEIKRVNNLINDQEFYGLCQIKVPIKKYSFTKEKLEQENALKRINVVDLADGEISEVGNVERAREERLERVVCIRNYQDSKVFLQQMDADLERIRRSTKVKKDSLEEVTRSLTCKRFRPMVVQQQRFCEMPKIRTLIIIIVSALIAFPILLYLLMQYKKNYLST